MALRARIAMPGPRGPLVQSEHAASASARMPRPMTSETPGLRVSYFGTQVAHRHSSFARNENCGGTRQGPICPPLGELVQGRLPLLRLPLRVAGQGPRAALDTRKPTALPSCPGCPGPLSPDGSQGPRAVPVSALCIWQGNLGSLSRCLALAVPLKVSNAPRRAARAHHF